VFPNRAQGALEQDVAIRNVGGLVREPAQSRFVVVALAKEHAIHERST